MAPTTHIHLLTKREHEDKTWLGFAIAGGILLLVAVLGLLTVWYRYLTHQRAKDIDRCKSAVLETTVKYVKLDDVEEMTAMHGALSMTESSPPLEAVSSHSKFSSSASSSSRNDTTPDRAPNVPEQSSPCDLATKAPSTDRGAELRHSGSQESKGSTETHQAILESRTSSRSRRRSPSPGPDFFANHKIPTQEEISLAMPQPTRPRPYGLSSTERLYDSYEERGRSLTPHDTVDRSRSPSVASQVMNRNASMLQPRGRPASPVGFR